MRNCGAVCITHGHEDHIGAAPYVLRKVNAPVYGTRLTLALVEHKLKEHRVNNVQLNVIKAGDKVKLGAFTVEFLKVSHSIAGAVALAIHTPVGTVIHTGDFKVDYTPIDNEQMDLGRLAELGREGVLASALRFHQRGTPGVHHVRASGGRDLQTTCFRRPKAALSWPCSPATSIAFSRWWTTRCVTTARSV